MIIYFRKQILSGDVSWILVFTAKWALCDYASADEIAVKQEAVAIWWSSLLKRMHVEDKRQPF